MWSRACTGVVDICLIPEVEFSLEKPGGVRAEACCSAKRATRCVRYGTPHAYLGTIPERAVYLARCSCRVAQQPATGAMPLATCHIRVSSVGRTVLQSRGNMGVELWPWPMRFPLCPV